VETTIPAAEREWGLNRSTLRKALEAEPQRFPGVLRGYTWFFDDASPQFLAWLRDHVLSRRVRGDLSALRDMAKVAVSYHPWEVEDTSREENAHPLEVLLRLSAGRLVPGEERVRIRHAFAEELGLQPDSRPAVAYTDAFFRLAEAPGEKKARSLLERAKLLRFAYVTYQEEAIEQGAFTRLLGDCGGYAIGDHRLVVGDSCVLEVEGRPICGVLDYQEALSWHLSTRDETIILIHPGMPARLEVAARALTTTPQSRRSRRDLPGCVHPCRREKCAG
jgi:hypothetical protein